MKKQILTFAALAAIAVGAAVTGNAKGTFNVKPETSTSEQCTDIQPCHVDPSADCRFLGVDYIGNDGEGDCDLPMGLN